MKAFGFTPSRIQNGQKINFGTQENGKMSEHSDAEGQLVQPGALVPVWKNIDSFDDAKRLIQPGDVVTLRHDIGDLASFQYTHLVTSPPTHYEDYYREGRAMVFPAKAIKIERYAVGSNTPNLVEDVPVENQSKIFTISDNTFQELNVDGTVRDAGIRIKKPY